jgi:hypothetical protein
MRCQQIVYCAIKRWGVSALPDSNIDVIFIYLWQYLRFMAHRHTAALK